MMPFGRRRSFTPASAALALAAVPAIGTLDYLTGSELSLFILYVIPVSLASLSLGRGYGFLAALESALVWYVVDAKGHRTYSNPLFPLWNAAARFALLVLIAEFQTRWQHERAASRTDFLTGLANRARFFEAGLAEIYRARRYEQPLSLCSFDIDNFKAVNDRLGHQAGDSLLQALGRSLRENTRASDLAARLGGDEFALLLPNTDARAAASLVGKLQARLRSEMAANRWPVDFSFGVLTVHAPPDTVEELLREADELMYEAKKSGKGCVRQRSVGL